MTENHRYDKSETTEESGKCWFPHCVLDESVGKPTYCGDCGERGYAYPVEAAKWGAIE